MHSNMRKNKGRFVAYGVFVSSLLFIGNTIQLAYAQIQRKNEIKKEDTFNRPEPVRPIQPEVPKVNRYQDDKVFLEYADSLYKVKNRRDTTEKQILKGDVKFRQGGMWMFCDSAYYYPEVNSLDAFSNVRMEQGDTLFVFADKLFYNGDARMAYLKNGPSREKVTMINRDVTLTTDSLDYDLGLDLGWYSRWGTIDDKVNTLTSLYGEYSPATKRAEFYTDVVLLNNRDGFTMITDTLHYNTETHIANIDSKTEIRGENDTILTTLATYYTDTGDADLLSRSTIIHKDSTGNITTLEGDSIIYDNTTRISRVFMFQDPYKNSYPMVLTDTAQKTTLIGGFGIYNDSTKEALATIYPLLMEYSQGDTLFLRADTIKTYIVTEKIPSKKRKIKTLSGYPENNGVPIVIIDSTKFWIDTLYFNVRPPLEDLPINLLIAALPPGPNKGYENLSVVEVVDTTGMENNLDLTISEDVEENSDNEDIEIINLEATDRQIDVQDSIPYDFHVALAYHRGRFFKKDIQGVADSLVFVERDSMLYMFRKPIIWSGERQVTGNRIDVHFNDSTTDWAYLPESGLMSEYVDEDFYNQITGKEIMAYFENNGLKKMDVSGNVETIFLPQESDSTFNRLVNAESSYLEIFLDGNKMDRLKMWPEVSGSVTPLFMVKRSQQYLPRFKWWSFLRPEKEYYEGRMKWADDLGEVSDDLEQYFLAPSDFGEPVTFSGKRYIPIAPPMPLANETTGANSLGVEKAEENLTLEDIIENEKSLNNENKIIEEETEKSLKEVLPEIEENVTESEKTLEEIINIGEI